MSDHDDSVDSRQPIIDLLNDGELGSSADRVMATLAVTQGAMLWDGFYDAHERDAAAILVELGAVERVDGFLRMTDLGVLAYAATISPKQFETWVGA